MATYLAPSTHAYDSQHSASQAYIDSYPDVYACSGLEVTHTVRALAVTRLLLPGAVVSGRSAAAIWGVDARAPADDVEVTVPPACRGGAVSGIRVSMRHSAHCGHTRTEAPPGRVIHPSPT